MGSLEVLFAVVVMFLAAICVVLALVVAAYWLLLQIHRLRGQLRRPPESYWRDHAAVGAPERRP